MKRVDGFDYPSPSAMARMSIAERLEVMSIPEPNSGCVLWLGQIDDKGYGRMKCALGRRTTLVHILAYETYVGPVPKGVDLDHLCRNHACRAEWHLEPVTRQVNLLRGDTIPARNAAKTECYRGHPFDDVNTYIDRQGKRNCRTCCRTNSRKRQRASAQTAAQAPERGAR